MFYVNLHFLRKKCCWNKQNL